MRLAGMLMAMAAAMAPSIMPDVYDPLLPPKEKNTAKRKRSPKTTMNRAKAKAARQARKRK